MMTPRNNIRHAKKTGFTVVELLVIAPIVLLTIGAFITVIVNMTGDVLASRSSNVLTYSIQDALGRIEDDVKFSSTFLAQTNVALTSPQGFNDDTTVFNNVDTTNGNMLILNTLATTANPLSSTSSLVYLTNLPNACSSPQLNQNTPMTTNIVYFVKNSSLWRRTIMPANYSTAGCNVPWQRPSCSPGISGAFCQAQDVKLVDNITPAGFIVQYYATADATTANSIASDTAQNATVRNAALQSIATVSASINVNTTTAGRNVSQSGTIRATKLDINASVVAPVVAPTTPSAPANVIATFNSPGNITVGWNPTSGTSYTLQYDTTSSFSAPTTINNITGLSQVVTGLNGAPTYYFRVSATNSAGTSGWSATANQWSTIVSGLVGWWNLNGTANATYGTSVNGVVTGATLIAGQNNQANGAYTFNGTSNIITYASTFGLGTTNVTMSMWVYNPTATNSGVFMKVGNLAGSGNGAGYGIGIGGTAFDNSTPGTNIVMLYENVRWIATTTALGTGWHHVVMTIDSGGTPYAYKDGVIVSGSYGGAGAQTPSTAVTALGAAQAATARYFNGRIDDARIYNRALSASEILSLYNSGAQ